MVLPILDEVFPEGVEMVLEARSEVVGIVIVPSMDKKLSEEVDGSQLVLWRVSAGNLVKESMQDPGAYASCESNEGCAVRLIVLGS